jgi:hypothetical protein
MNRANYALMFLTISELNVTANDNQTMSGFVWVFGAESEDSSVFNRPLV